MTSINTYPKRGKVVSITLLLVLLPFCSLLNFAYAQVNGVVTDENGLPIPFSNILLLDLDSALVKGTVADQSGAYQIENIDPGEYIIEVYSVGYNAVVAGPIKIVKNGQIRERETIILRESVHVLDGLVISEKKPLYEQKIDRLVVNIQSSITFAGNSALEVLQKSPGVQVNRQNNTITLNGKGGVLVMINEKITRLPIDAVVQMLDGMSAANVEKIELITTPPSRYDAEGTGGIIHIVMKESENWGTNGSFGVSAGYNGYETLGGNLNLFHRSKKIGILFDYSINYDHAEQTWKSFRSIDNEGFDWTINTNSVRDSKTTVQNLRAGVEYYVSDKTRADVLVTGYQRDWRMDAFTDSKNTVKSDSSLVTEMNIREKNLWQGAVINMGLDHRFTQGQSLSLDFDYVYYENDNPSDYQNAIFYLQSNESDQLLIDVNKNTPLTIKVVSADYSHQLSEKVKLEAGIKGSLSDFRNDVFVANHKEDQWVVVDSLTNIADLNEEILAAYISSHWDATDNFTISAGLRYEFTNTNLDTKKEKGVVDRQLNNIFPTIFFQQKLSQNSNFQLSYSKRITRPTFNDMAPFVFLVDPNTFFSGNPALRPAIINGYKADLNWNSFLLSLQYSDSKHEISRFQPSFDRQSNQQILYSVNMDRLRTWNLTTAIPFSPFKWWDVQSNLTGTYQQLFPTAESDAFDISSFSVNMTNTFKLPKDYTIELAGYYWSRGLFGLWKMQPLGSLDLGIQKKLKNDKGTLRLAFNDMFNNSIWRWSAVDRNDSAELNFRVRSVNLTYTGRFGNNKLRKVEIKSGSEAEQRRVN